MKNEYQFCFSGPAGNYPFHGTVQICYNPDQFTAEADIMQWSFLFKLKILIVSWFSTVSPLKIFPLHRLFEVLTLYIYHNPKYYQWPIRITQSVGQVGLDDRSILELTNNYR